MELLNGLITIVVMTLCSYIIVQNYSHVNNGNFAQLGFTAAGVLSCLFQVLVWKEIDYSQMNESSKQMLVVEVNLLRQLRHEFIVRYYDRIIDKSNSMLYIVMEYCDGGDLASYIEKIKSSQLVFILLFKILRYNI